MVSGFPSRHGHLRAGSRRAGIALVLTLSFLALLSVLILAFFSSVQTESQGAKSYSQSVSVKQLVDVAQNVVLGQITDATLSTKTARRPSDTTPIADSQRLTWASQPGMIRTWDINGTWQAFKLYSSASMVLDLHGSPYKSAGDASSPEVPADWSTQRAMFTDLNSPVTAPDQTGTAQQYYPIVDPRAVNDKIDGFRLDPVPGGGSGAGSGKSQSTIPANPAAMPVRWIYVLKDGTLTGPASSPDNGVTASWAGSPNAPSKDNPIVGRIAFWTDDETCKLNINTASEATPWDTPRAFCKADLQLGLYQPYNREYQRYPGHPFNVSLSPVFYPGLRADLPLATIPNYVKEPEKERIYALIPRVAGGGSAAATSNTNPTIVLDADRLYASPDELAYSDSARHANPILTTDRIKRAGFFLTTNNPSPELTAFGTPRVSMWPIRNDPTKRTSLDRLALFCTTLGGPTGSTNIYSFQRGDPNSNIADYQNITRNQNLYAYLQALLKHGIPGFGSSSFAKKWTTDADQVLTEIFDYIRCTNLRDPLIATETDQYTYDKSSRNGARSIGQVTPIVIGDTKGFGRFHSISQFGFHFICSQQGIKNQTTGKVDNVGVLGAAGTLKQDERMIETGFMFEPFSPSLGFFRLSEDMCFDVSFSDFKINGQSLNMPSALRTLNDDIGQGFHSNGREHGGSGGVRGPLAAMQGRGGAFISGANGSSGNPRIIVGSNGATTMDFSGGTVTVKIYAGATANPNQLAQTFTVTVPPGKFPLPDLVQSVTEGYRTESTAPVVQPNFWWTLSSRYSHANDQPQVPGDEYVSKARHWDRGGSGATSNGAHTGFKTGSVFRREDVVRSIVPLHGDIRLVAGLRDVVSTTAKPLFVPVRDGDWSSVYRFSDIFQNNSGPHFMFGFSNEPVAAGTKLTTNPLDIHESAPDEQLTANATVQYHYSRLPEIRPGAGKTYNFYGDFDNGPAQWIDGSYINKPDEGSENVTNSINGVAYPYWAWNDTPGNFSAKYYSPNRIIPSPGMLGSLPVGVKRNLPWTTLLFRPQLTGAVKHPGTVAPMDHQIMDLFWMPVIEPYAISEPFSTGGKVNMNYEIAPFTYIRRTTALHGAFKGEMPMVIPNQAGPAYKLWDHESNDNGIMPDSSRDQDANVASLWKAAYSGVAPFDKMRLPIDLESDPKTATIAQFDTKFQSGDLFRSATQICELHLVRQGETLFQYQNSQIWPKALLTGDNTRERPYTNLYGKLTTKSNAYTIHIRAQVLHKAGGAALTDADWQTWKEGKDIVESEYRGSTLVERYLESTDPNLVDYALSPNAVLDTAYRTRIISTKKFAP